MADIAGRQPERVIEHQCEAVCMVEWLQQQWTLRRNQAYATKLEEIRQHVLEANTAACRAWFDHDTLTDLPPAA